MRPVKYTYQPAHGDRRHFVDEADVAVVLERLPAELIERLTEVHFRDARRGRRVLGYTTNRGRREVTLSALPPRVSLTSYLRRSQSPTAFGAVRGTQWPTRAVRRFMLYDVLLHEIGHLQVVGRGKSRRFASETKAQDFAESLCRNLWSEPFEHPDPVHNAPSPEELERLRQDWPRAHAEYKRGLLHEVKGEFDLAAKHYDEAVRCYPDHALALEGLGVVLYFVSRSSVRSAVFLERAVQCDPALRDAHLYLALALGERGHEERARHHFERALRLFGNQPSVLATYGRMLGQWGHRDEGASLLERAARRAPDNWFVQFQYQAFLDQTDRREHGKQTFRKAPNPPLEGKVVDDRLFRWSRGTHLEYRYSASAE